MGVGPTFNLRNYAGQRGAVIQATGNGSATAWRGAGADVAIDGVHATGLNNSGIAGATTSGIRFDSAGGRLKVADATLAMQGTAPGVCIDVINGLQSFQAIGNTFITCSAPISLAGTAPSLAVAVGNTSVGTTGAAVVVGAMGPYLVDQANQWDKPGPNWSQWFRASDGALVFSNQGHDQVYRVASGSAAPGRLRPIPHPDSPPR